MFIKMRNWFNLYFVFIICNNYIERLVIDLEIWLFRWKDFLYFDIVGILFLVLYVIIMMLDLCIILLVGL